MRRETLKVTWKIIRRKGYGRTPETYCSYIAENENHKHRLRTSGGSKLFEMLQRTVISTGRADNDVLVDGMYRDDELQFVTNFRTTNKL